MSETTETPEGTPPAEPTPTPAPESTPAETEEPEQKPQREADEARGGDRRYAVVTAKLSAKERETEALRAENEFYRRQIQQQAPQDDTPELAMQRMRLQVRAEVEAEIKKDNFHAHGNSQYADWGQRTQRLIDMGADAGIAKLLVEMPVGEGVRVAGALAEDPEALQRIANIRTEQGRAWELGKYAARMESESPRAAASQITRAPAPIRPVTGRASPQFNEYTADADTLADRYMKQNLERQVRR